jgi:hypothetical protein
MSVDKIPLRNITNRITSFKEAKKLSILKWEYLAKHPKHPTGVHFELINQYPQLATIRAACGFCSYYRDYLNLTCTQCPLYRCTRDDHPYFKYAQASSFEEKREAAEELLKMIKQTKDPKRIKIKLGLIVLPL